MKYYLLTSVFFSSLSSFAQNANPGGGDSVFDDGIFVSATIYAFPYSADLDNGSAAAGITWLFTDERVGLQLGLLIDFRKYTQWESNHFYSHKYEVTNLLVPFIFHYNFLRTQQSVFFISLGALVGSNFYLNENDRAFQRDVDPILGGIGITHSLSKRIYFRATVNTQYIYSEKIFLPGLLLDLVLRIGK